MEEDIKIIEKYLENSAYKEKDSDFFKDGGWEMVDLEIPQAMENILKSYKQLKSNNGHQSREIKEAVDYAFELKAELDKAEKMIDLMAKYISTKNYADDICEFRLDVKGRFHKHCYKGECKDCIKEYFRKKIGTDENKI